MKPSTWALVTVLALLVAQLPVVVTTTFTAVAFAVGQPIVLALLAASIAGHKARRRWRKA